MDQRWTQQDSDNFSTPGQSLLRAAARKAATPGVWYKNPGALYTVRNGDKLFEVRAPTASMMAKRSAWTPYTLSGELPPQFKELLADANAGIQITPQYLSSLNRLHKHKYYTGDEQGTAVYETVTAQRAASFLNANLPGWASAQARTNPILSYKRVVKRNRQPLIGQDGKVVKVTKNYQDRKVGKSRFTVSPYGSNNIYQPPKIEPFRRVKRERVERPEQIVEEEQ